MTGYEGPEKMCVYTLDAYKADVELHKELDAIDAVEDKVKLMPFAEYQKIAYKKTGRIVNEYIPQPHEFLLSKKNAKSQQTSCLHS